MKGVLLILAAVTIVGAAFGCALSTSPGTSSSAAVPSAPSGISATAVATGDGEVSVSWSSVSGATSYNLYWAAASTVTTTTGTKVAGVSSPMVLNNIPQGTQYSYIVTATNSAGEGPASAVASSTLPTTTSHVYIAGWIYPYPVYWRDGVLHRIGTTSGYWAYSVAVSGTDVYVMGADFANATYVYWKNDAMTTLPLPAGVSFKFSYGIAVAGGHVYVAAVGMNGSGQQIPLLWTDGVVAELPVPSADASDNAGMQGNIVATANDAYAYGATYTNSGGGHSLFWKNGALTTGQSGGWITDGTISGTDVLLAGWEPGTTTSSVGGYSDITTSAQTFVTDLAGSPGSLVDGIAVSGSGGVYLAGETNDWSPNPPSRPVYWTGATPAALPLPSGYATASAMLIAVGGGDVYIVGYPVTRSNFWTSSNPMTPLLWKNGSLVTLQLPSGDTAAEIYPGEMTSRSTDVYLVGRTGAPSGTSFDLNYKLATHAVYWKNGALNQPPLGALTGNSAANVVAVWPN